MPDENGHDEGHKIVAELLGWSVEEVEDYGRRLREQLTGALEQSLREQGHDITITDR